MIFNIKNPENMQKTGIKSSLKNFSERYIINKKNVASNPCIDYWQHCNIIKKIDFSRDKSLKK